MHIQIPDDLAVHYKSYRPRVKTDTICTQQLERFQSVAPSDRILILRSEDIRALEDTLSASQSITSAADLQAAVAARTALTLAGRDIPFTNSALAEIARRAEKEGISTGAMLDRIAKDALQLMVDDV